MAKTSILNLSLDNHHDLSVCFVDNSDDIMSGIIDNAENIYERNLKKIRFIGKTYLTVQVISIIVFFISVFWIAISGITYWCKEMIDNKVVSGTVSSSMRMVANSLKPTFIIFIIISAILLLLLFYDYKITDFFEEMFCEKEYKIKNYCSMQEAIKAYEKKSAYDLDMKYTIVDASWLPVVSYEQLTDKIMLNAHSKIRVNDKLQDGVLLIDGRMNTDNRQYNMDAQMNERTKDFWEKCKKG